MEKMKTLADQLREEMSKPGDKLFKGAPVNDATVPPSPLKRANKITEAAILKALIEYDNRANKSMVHARFDKKTVDIMNKFKMATGVDVTKFVSYAVKHFLDTHPELKMIIKQFIQNTDL